MTKLRNNRTGKKPYIQLIPTKIYDILPDLSELMNDIPGFHIDRLKQIVSTISVHIRKDENNTAPLMMNYLNKAVPQADKYVNNLLDLSILERHGSYQPGITAYKYGFSPEYQSVLTGIPLFNPWLENRIQKLSAEHFGKNHSQNDDLRNMSIATDCPEFIKTTFGHNIDSYNYAKSSATRIENKDFYSKVDDTGNRFHHNATNMQRDLRPLLRIRGQQVTEVDVKNCQPYLTTKIFTDPAKLAPFAKYRKLALILETLQVTQTEDVKKYISLVNNGVFYEYFRDEYSRMKSKSIDREEAKGMMLKILFARNSHRPRGRKEFEILFPEVARIFALIRGDEKGGKFRSYERFSILLQRVESHIINDLVCKRIKKEHPGVIALSIFDSIMTGIFTNHVEIVSAVMQEEFEKFVGYAPILKAKDENEKKPRAISLKKEREKEEKGEKGRGKGKEGNMILESLQLNDNKTVKEKISLAKNKKKAKTPLPEGTIGPKTQNSISLLYALGYTHENLDNGFIRILKVKGCNGKRVKEGCGIINRADLFSWLSDRHKILYIADMKHFERQYKDIE